MTAVTVDDLRAARWSLAMHLNNGSQGHQYAYEAPEFPEASIQKGWSKPRRKDAKVERWSVMKVRVGTTYLEAPLANLDECARLIMRARQLVATDQAWDAADPSTRDAARKHIGEKA